MLTIVIKVLLVEDEKVIREGIKTILEEVIQGYQVLWEASNGEKALEILNIELPDLIITDIRMPKMTGIEFIRLLKEKNAGMPVIVISGHDEYVYVREALKLGVKDYLLKPISRQELASILDSIFISEKGSEVEVVDDNGLIVSEIKQLINKNLEENLSLDFISKVMGFHPNYLSSLFSNQTNIKLSDYILQQRILKAKELLENTNLKIYDIAHLSGFSNPKYFSSVFKRNEEMTPQQFRVVKKRENL